MATLTANPGAGSQSTGSSAGSGVDLDLGGAYDSALSTLEGSQVQGDQDGAAGESAEVSLGQQETVDPAQSETQEALPEGESPVVPEGEWPLSPDGKSHLVPKSAVAELKAAQDYQRAVAEFFPDVPSAQQAAFQAHDFRVFNNDWASGTDEGIRGVLAHLAGVNHQQIPQMQFRYQQAFAKMAAQIPGILQQVNPQAHIQLMSELVQARIQDAYKNAQTDEDFLRAQYMDWGHTGKYLTERPKVDPQLAERQAFETQQKDFQRRQDLAMERDLQGFNQQAVEGAKYSQLWAEIDKLLEPLKSRYSEKTISDARAGIQKDVVDSLMKNSEWWLEHRQAHQLLADDFRQTWRQGQPGAGLQPRAQHYISDFLSRAKRQLPGIVQARFQGAPRKPGPKPQTAAPSNGQQAPLPNSRPSSSSNGAQLSDRERGDKDFSQFFQDFRSSQNLR